MDIDTTDVVSVTVTYTNGTSTTLFPNAITSLDDDLQGHSLTIV